MRRFWTVSGGLAIAASIGIVALAMRASATPMVPIPHPPSPMDGPGVFVPRGAGSCAAAACHGSATPVEVTTSAALRNEHTTWITADPHANAYEVLRSPRSERIAAHLGKRSGKKIPAETDGRCLACHATPGATAAGPIGSDEVDSILRDGVGCESCHGPSGGWLSEHTAVNWQGMNKAALGFRDLKDLGTRAETCTGCHVGAPADKAKNLPARDVNHDLIAAGHPRLNWEFAAYSANYPRHWRATPSDRDARLWQVGQVATMRAALDLLDDRAAKAAAGTAGAPWPEFSEYGCFSCHFSLKEKSLRGDNRDPAVKLGTPALGSWNVPIFKAMVETYPGAPPDVASKLSDLRAVMGKFHTDPATIHAPTAALRESVDKWLKSPKSPYIETKIEQEVIQAYLDALNKRSQNASEQPQLVTGWDSAAQLYLALASLYRTQEQIQAPNADLRKQLEALRKALEFRDGFDSPGNFDPAKIK